MEGFAKYQIRIHRSAENVTVPILHQGWEQDRALRNAKKHSCFFLNEFLYSLVSIDNLLPAPSWCVLMPNILDRKHSSSWKQQLDSWQSDQPKQRAKIVRTRPCQGNNQLQIFWKPGGTWFLTVSCYLRDPSEKVLASAWPVHWAVEKARFL